MAQIPYTRAGYYLAREKLIEAIQANKCTVDTIAEFMGVTEGYVCAVIYSLRQEEDCPINKSGKGRDAIYSVKTGVAVG